MHCRPLSFSTAGEAFPQHEAAIADAAAPRVSAIVPYRARTAARIPSGVIVSIPSPPLVLSQASVVLPLTMLSAVERLEAAGGPSWTSGSPSRRAPHSLWHTYTGYTLYCSVSGVTSLRQHLPAAPARRRFVVARRTDTRHLPSGRHP